MKLRYFLLVTILAVPVLSFAQGDRYYQDEGRTETSTLSIYSESGEPFYLILNGIRQNIVPQSRIRVEALPQYLNDVQINFADRGTAPIHKKVTIADPVDGRAVNLVLKINRGRSGYARLKFQRMTEVEHNYHGPRDEYVMYYGKPQQINTTETTYTDPVTGQVITQTTTTTTTDDAGYHEPHREPSAPVAMDSRSFSDAKQSIANSSFDETRLSTAKTILNSNYVTTAQVMEICQLFSFEDSKLKFAKFAYSRTVDPNNYYKVANVFSFDASKNDLNNFISGGRR